MPHDPKGLCRACALCCDGTLFSIVRLRADEPARMRARSLPVVERDGGAVMPQRCAALAGSDCSIYEERPSQCAAFECLLLLAVRADEVSLDEAHAIVAEARALPRDDAFLRKHFLGRSGVR